MEKIYKYLRFSIYKHMNNIAYLTFSIFFVFLYIWFGKICVRRMIRRNLIVKGNPIGKSEEEQKFIVGIPDKKVSFVVKPNVLFRVIQFRSNENFELTEIII